MELIKWIRNNGGFVNRSLKIKETNFGNGIFTKSNIPKGFCVSDSKF